MKYIFLQFTWKNWNSCSHNFWGFPFHPIHPVILALRKPLFLLYFLTDSNSCSPFFSHQYSLLKITFLCHTWVPLIHNAVPRIIQTGKLSLCCRDRLTFFFFFLFKSRCLLRHRLLITTNKQQCDIQKLIFLQILFNPFPIKAKKSLQVGILEEVRNQSFPLR